MAHFLRVPATLDDYRESIDLAFKAGRDFYMAGHQDEADWLYHYNKDYRRACKERGWSVSASMRNAHRDGWRAAEIEFRVAAASSVKTTAVPAPAYDYKLLTMRGPEITHDEAALCALGAEGWELIAIDGRGAAAAGAAAAGAAAAGAAAAGAAAAGADDPVAYFKRRRNVSL